MKTRFFRVLWRINAVLICLAAILVAFVCAVASYFIIGEISKSHVVQNVAKLAVPEKMRQEKAPEICRVDKLELLNFVRCRFAIEDDYKGGSFSSGRSSETINYLYYNLADGSTHWLLPNQNSIIRSCDDHYYPASPSDKRVLRWTSFVTTTCDSNGNGGTAIDLRTFGVAHGDGTSYTVLISGFEAIRETILIEEFKLLVFYRKEKKELVSMIDLKEMKIVRTSPLDK